MYAAKSSELLLSDLPRRPRKSKPSQVFNDYETLIDPIKRAHSQMSNGKREAHRRALRQVLIDVAKDITGESSERLVYFFYSFGFVEEEIRLIQSRRWWIRAQAARSMGLLGARKAIAALTAALEDSHPDVRNQAMQALVRLVGPDALRTILRLSTRLSRWTAIELSVIVTRLKESAVPYLIEALAYSDQSVVLFATEMLGEIGFVQAVPPLMRLSSSTKDTAIQASALKALSRLGDERPRHLIMELLESQTRAVRLSAIEALGRIAGKNAAERLQPFLKRGRKDEKLAAARALATIGKTGISVLRSVTSEEDGSAAAIAWQVLEEFGIKSAEA
jgi:HEAT repeat protein